MRNLEFKDQLHEYAEWREKLIQAIEMYQEWRTRYKLSDAHSTDTLLNILNGLQNDRVTLAFAAEFSRGKTELINALFFAETGVRLLPSLLDVQPCVLQKYFMTLKVAIFDC